MPAMFQVGHGNARFEQPLHLAVGSFWQYGRAVAGDCVYRVVNGLGRQSRVQPLQGNCRPPPRHCAGALPAPPRPWSHAPTYPSHRRSLPWPTPSASPDRQTSQWQLARPTGLQSRRGCSWLNFQCFQSNTRQIKNFFHIKHLAVLHPVSGRSSQANATRPSKARSASVCWLPEGQTV